MGVLLLSASLAMTSSCSSSRQTFPGLFHEGRMPGFLQGQCGALEAIGGVPPVLSCARHKGTVPTRRGGACNPSRPAVRIVGQVSLRRTAYGTGIFGHVVSGSEIARTGAGAGDRDRFVPLRQDRTRSGGLRMPPKWEDLQGLEP